MLIRSILTLAVLGSIVVGTAAQAQPRGFWDPGDTPLVVSTDVAPAPVSGLDLGSSH